MTGNVVWGKLKLPDHGHDHAHGSDDHASKLPTDLSTREIGILVPLAALCILLGVYPKPILSLIEQPVQETVLVVNETGRVNLPVKPIESDTKPHAPIADAPAEPAARVVSAENAQ